MSAPSNSISRSSISRRVIYSLALAVVVYLILSIWGSRSGLGTAVRLFHWGYFPLLLLMALGNYGARFLKWEYYLRVLKLPVPRGESLLIFLSGLSLSITPGKLGEAVKSYFLRRRYGYPVARTVPLVLADRLTDLMALVILAAVGAIGFSYGQRVVWAVAGLIILLMIVITIRSIGEKLLAVVTKLSFLTRWSTTLHTLYDASFELLNWRRVGWPLILSIIAWGLEALAFYVVFLAMGLPFGPLAAIFIYTFSTIVGALTLMPGGLGVTEGAMAGLLSLLNVAAGSAALATLIIRLATLWFGVGLGTICLILAEQRLGVNIEEMNKA